MKKGFLTTILLSSFIIFSFYQREDILTPVTLPKKVTSVKANISSTPPPPTTTTSPQINPTTTPTDNLPTTTVAPTAISRYKNGSYSGDPEDAIYGTIQVKATIKNGQITDVSFLQYPNERSTSVYINSQADPLLAQEAVQSQTANVDIVSGATYSSEAFVQSLQTALSKAQN